LLAFDNPKYFHHISISSSEETTEANSSLALCLHYSSNLPRSNHTIPRTPGFDFRFTRAYFLTTGSSRSVAQLF